MVHSHASIFELRSNEPVLSQARTSAEQRYECRHDDLPGAVHDGLL
jgi:hypothetical protein